MEALRNYITLMWIVVSVYLLPSFLKSGYKLETNGWELEPLAIKPTAETLKGLLDFITLH